MRVLLVVAVLAAGCGPPVPFSGLYAGKVNGVGDCRGSANNNFDFEMGLLLDEHTGTQANPGWVDAETAGCGAWHFGGSARDADYHLEQADCAALNGSALHISRGTLSHSGGEAAWVDLIGTAYPVVCAVEIRGTLQPQR